MALFAWLVDPENCFARAGWLSSYHLKASLPQAGRRRCLQLSQWSEWPRSYRGAEPRNTGGSRPIRSRFSTQAMDPNGDQALPDRASAVQHSSTALLTALPSRPAGLQRSPGALPSYLEGCRHCRRRGPGRVHLHDNLAGSRAGSLRYLDRGLVFRPDYSRCLDLDRAQGLQQAAFVSAVQVAKQDSLEVRECAVSRSIFSRRGALLPRAGRRRWRNLRAAGRKSFTPEPNALIIAR